MGWWSTVQSIAGTLGVKSAHVDPLGCELGTRVFRETRRAAQIVNVRRPSRPLTPATVARLQPLYAHADLSTVRVRTRCRLPANRFAEDGSIYAMTFGSTIYFRDELDEQNPLQLVHLMHELVHVDQVAKLGGLAQFACAYGTGYLHGDGQLPAFIHEPTAYHRNPLEAEAYTFEARFRDEQGRVVASELPSTGTP